MEDKKEKVIKAPVFFATDYSDEEAGFWYTDGRGNNYVLIEPSDTSSEVSLDEDEELDEYSDSSSPIADWSGPVTNPEGGLDSVGGPLSQAGDGGSGAAHHNCRVPLCEAKHTE